MESIFEKVKESVKVYDVISDFWRQPDRNNKVLCPFHNEKTGSLSIDVNTNKWRCFGCGKGGDAIDFVAELKEIETLEAAKILAEKYNIPYETKEDGACSIPEYLRKCMREIGKTDYFKRRGLTAATIKKFCLGYDEYRQSVTIPYSSKLHYYQSRSIVDKKFFKPKTEEAGAEPLYNAERISAKWKEPVFVVESPICAMSIEQCGGLAVSTCGVGGWRKLSDAIIKCKFQGGVILCFDNDEAGKNASQALAAELLEQGTKYIAYNIAGDCKDPNELLMKDPKALEENISAAKMALRKSYATEKDSFDACDLVAEKISPVAWIVENMLPTGLALLCAPSKYGKSWMVLQLCLAVAEGKTFLEFKTVQCDTLYYALEDGKSRLQDRIMKVLKGKKPSRRNHFVIKADSIESGLLKKVEEELKTFPEIKLVIIDTLQKVRGKMSKEDTLYGNEYREMGKVKDFADKNNICVLFVHHLRKMADESDVYNMISGSNALMGAADTIFIISKKKRAETSATFSMTGRDIQQKDLVITFNKADYLWELEGTAEEIAARREREDYENNIYVRTIKELVKRNPMGGWSGSAQDLMKAVYDITGTKVADSSTSVGKQIAKYDYRLHCDDIEHKASKSNTRAHTFKKIIREVPVYYQKTIYERDD